MAILTDGDWSRYRDAIKEAANDQGWAEAGAIRAQVGGTEAQVYDDLDDLVAKGGAVRRKNVKHYGIKEMVVDGATIES